MKAKVSDDWAAYGRRRTSAKYSVLLTKLLKLCDACQRSNRGRYGLVLSQ